MAAGVISLSLLASNARQLARFAAYSKMIQEPDPSLTSTALTLLLMAYSDYPLTLGLTAGPTQK